MPRHASRAAWLTAGAVGVTLFGLLARPASGRPAAPDVPGAHAPAAIEQPASRSLAEFIRATGSTTVLAQLRPATYCGPGSGGDRGSWILDVSGDGPDGYRHALHIIEAA